MMITRKRFWATWAGRQLLVCAAGLAISLLPSAARAPAFWGVHFLEDAVSGEVVVGDVDPDSPAAAAGLQADDEVTYVNGEPADADTLRDALGDMPPGKRLPLTVRRNDKEQILYAVGRPESAFLFWHWQFATALTFLALAAVLIATQPLEPAPLWRPLAAGAVGFVLAAAVPTLGERAAWEVVWQPASAVVSGPYGPALPLEAAAALAGGALTVLAAFEVRAILFFRPPPPDLPGDAAAKFTPTAAPPRDPPPDHGLTEEARSPGR